MTESERLGTLHLHYMFDFQYIRLLAQNLYYLCVFSVQLNVWRVLNIVCNGYWYSSYFFIKFKKH